MDSKMDHRPSGTQPFASPKLKDSCTACATSKVKCSKDKPDCARCTRRGLACEYGTSKRTGRTSHASKTAAQGQTGLRRPSVVRSITDSNPSAPVANMVGNPMARLPMDACISPLTLSATMSPLNSRLDSQQPYADLWQSLMDTSMTQEPAPQPSHGVNEIDDLFASLSSYSMDSASMSMPSQAFSDASSMNFDPFSSVFDTFGQQDLTATDLATGYHCQPSIEPSNCCLTVVLGFLTQLFPNASSGCTLPGSLRGASRLMTIDNVISDNRQIIDQMVKMLECPCSHDEYLLTIIALVCFKLMAWYAAAARDKPSFDDEMNWNSPDQRRPSHSRTHSEEVLHFPTAMDGYCTEGTDSGRMAAQLVLSELHRVQRLVNLLSQRLEAVRLRSASNGTRGSSLDSLNDASDPSAAFTSSSPLSAASFDQLETDLRKRLRAVSFETIDVLRRG